MKECWINVYEYRNGNVRLGMVFKSAYSCDRSVWQAERNGAYRIYRIHVRMK